MDEKRKGRAERVAPEEGKSFQIVKLSFDPCVIKTTLIIISCCPVLNLSFFFDHYGPKGTKLKLVLANPCDAQAFPIDK